MEKQILIDFVNWLEKSPDYALCQEVPWSEEWQLALNAHEIVDRYLEQLERI